MWLVAPWSRCRTLYHQQFPTSTLYSHPWDGRRYRTVECILCLKFLEKKRYEVYRKIRCQMCLIHFHGAAYSLTYCIYFNLQVYHWSSTHSCDIYRVAILFKILLIILSCEYILQSVVRLWLSLRRFNSAQKNHLKQCQCLARCFKKSFKGGNIVHTYLYLNKLCRIPSLANSSI